MDPISYITSNRSDSWRDDVGALWNLSRGHVTDSQAFAMRRHFANRCVRRIVFYIPSQLYHLSRLFLAVMICSLGKWVHNHKWVRLAKFEVNKEIIFLASHSLDTTIFQVGWLHARTGLACHAVHRLCYRASIWTNQYVCRRFGFPRVESGEDSPISYKGLRMALWTHARRIFIYVKLIFVRSFLLYVADKLRKESFKAQLGQIVLDGVHLLRHKLDIPRYELAMAFPSLGGERADAVAEVVHRAICYLLDIVYPLVEQREAGTPWSQIAKKASKMIVSDACIKVLPTAIKVTSVLTGGIGLFLLASQMGKDEGFPTPQSS
jgi:hypothetical protein